MSKRIKIIDLLNKMANDKNYRPTVKFLAATYKYNEKMEDYESNINSDWGIFSDYTINNILNDEVELIEDETIDIESIDELLVEQLKNREHTNADIYELAKQQNEILQGLKQLNKEIKELKSLDIETSEKEINEALKRARNQKYGEE